MEERMLWSEEGKVLHGRACTLSKGLRPMENTCCRTYIMKGLWPMDKPVPEQRKQIRMKEQL